jgi:hypothetical protein
VVPSFVLTLFKDVNMEEIAIPVDSYMNRLLRVHFPSIIFFVVTNQYWTDKLKERKGLNF